MSHPHLDLDEAPPDARGLVLMLHGGKAASLEPVGGRSLSWQRAAVLVGSIGAGLREEGLGTALLRYRHRGWNERYPGGPTPIPDARWALDRIRDAHGDLPVVLLGHSMGARTAVRVADDPSVVGVVALAPWLPPGDPVRALAGKRLIAAHGSRDRITSAAMTRAYVSRARSVADSAEFVDMGPLGHYLVRGARDWNDVALRECLATFAHARGRRR